MYFSSIHVVLKLYFFSNDNFRFYSSYYVYTGREERGDQVNINTDNLVSMTEAKPKLFQGGKNG